MKKPLEFYQKNISLYQRQVKELKNRLQVLGWSRLIVFLIGVLGTFLIYPNFLFSGIFALISMVLFIVLILNYNAVKIKSKKKQILQEINQLEVDVMHGDLSKCDSGKEFINPEHEFSYDIDLFGENSFFAYLNRTCTRDGKILLANLVDTNSIEKILEKQKAIQELSNMPDWRQDFWAIAKMIQSETNHENILKWFNSYQSFVPKWIFWLTNVFSVISILIILLISFSGLSFYAIVLWFFVGVGISFKFFKPINQLYEDANAAKDTFRQFNQLLKKIEETPFDSSLLNAFKEKIYTPNQEASKLVNQFSKVLDAFDQRNNDFIGILGNGLFLRDLRLCFRIENWIEQNHTKIKDWFETVTKFDAYNSMGNYAFNHPQHVFAQVDKNDAIVKAIELGHPMIVKSKRIGNDFSINSNDFFIITGANMAGKSTFLRTVGLSLVMANLGLPVCAKTFVYNPIKLITSMRTADSLSKEESYFFSELKRLKYIVEEIQKDTYFIILDEILKGTNSTDKAIGSKKFVEKLISTHATGIIATHDLSLCELEEKNSEIHNYYFDAEIKNDQLYFDYRLKKGVCQNMNASFLLKKMQIVN